MAMIEQLRPAIIGGGIVDPCDFQPPPPATPETAAPEPAKPEPVTEDTVIVAGAPIAIPPAGTTPWDAEDDEPPAKGASNPDYPGIDPSQ